MDDLVAFLRARLGEAAERAQAAGGGEWSLQEHEGDTVLIYDSNGEPVVYDEGWPTPAQARHIVGQSPARALRGVEAKRRIVERYAWLREHGDTGDAAWVLPLLAAAYSDHPDYRPEWAPEGDGR